MTIVVIVSVPNHDQEQSRIVSMQAFGFHSYRRTLWGSHLLRYTLGLRLIPLLRGGDLLGLAGPDLDELEREAQIIEQNIPKIVEQAQPLKDPEFFSERLQAYTKHLFQAINEARELGGVIDIC